jgi:NAD+ diphosphatase
VTPPPLARSTLDRAAHRRTDGDWLAAAWTTGLVLLVDTEAGGLAPVRDVDDGVRLVLVPAADAPDRAPADRLFLGVDTDGTALFAVDAPVRPREGVRAASLRDVGHLLDDRDTGVFTAAVALAHWHAGHRFSPATGRRTAAVDAGWARLDPEDPVRSQHFPRTDPAVIVLVHDGVAGPGGRCLLGHAPGWRSRTRRRFSCLAGFIEAGESAEAAVVREVREEVGVEVGRIAYVGSQAWPFPCSLMLGFTAYADPALPLRVDPAEIAEARWFRRDQVAAAYAGERVDVGGDRVLGLPMNASIAAYLIGGWLKG